MSTSSPTSSPTHNLAFPMNSNGTIGPAGLPGTTYTVNPTTTTTYTTGAAIYTVGGAGGGGGVNWGAGGGGGVNWGAGGGGGVNWTAAAQTYNYANVIFNDGTVLNPNTITVKGEAEIQGTLSIGKDILMKGKSLEARLEEIEKRMAILHNNPELEKKWEGLRKLGEEYRVMEKDVVEKELIWSILKNGDIPY